MNVIFRFTGLKRLFVILLQFDVDLAGTVHSFIYTCEGSMGGRLEFTCVKLLFALQEKGHGALFGDEGGGGVIGVGAHGWGGSTNPHKFHSEYSAS
jgi:hypothetical protein